MEDSYVLQIKERQFSELYLCFCGYAKCGAGHSFGPAVRPNYIIHYILEGRGSYTVDGVRYELEAGQGFLIEPRRQTFYRADESEPWSYLWVGFDGKRAEEYLKGMGLGENRLIYRCSHGSQLKETVLKMLRHNTYTASDQFILEGLLYSFFGVLSEDMDILSASEKKHREPVREKSSGVYSEQLLQSHPYYGYCGLCLYQQELSVHSVSEGTRCIATGLSFELSAHAGVGTAGDNRYFH